MNKEEEFRNKVGVCLASKSFYPLYAGPAVRFQRYAPGLAQRGICMQVFTQAITDQLLERDGSLANGNHANYEQPATNTSPYPLFEVIDNLPVQRVELPSGWRGHVAYFRKLIEYCQANESEIDTVQLLNLDIWAIPWLYQLRRLGISAVFTHTLLGDFSANSFKQNLQRIHRRLPLNLVDCVVVSSSAMQLALENLGVSTSIQIIPNGVDLQRFQPVSNAKKAELRQKLALNPDWDIILAIGPIIPRKGTDALVEAFVSLCRDYPNAHLILVGPRHDLARDGLTNFHNNLQQMISAAGAEERVTFTGPVSNVQDYLQAADLLVFPSRREGMPNVVPEAMACGLPIIMTPFIGLPKEFGQRGTHYILSDWKLEVLSKDIRSLLTDTARRQILGEAARMWVAQNLDVNQSLDAYAELYQSIKTNKAKARS
jgi:glycosyltransferase involved in cell wall biosynthesis